MDSPLSPIIADITMQDLEIKALEALTFVPPFYVRYVDDIAMSVPSSQKNSTLETFNSLHSRIQFTLEEGTNKHLNFLDTTIIVRDDTIEFDWYHKPTFSGRYLNFASSQPLCHKKGTIKCLTDRAILLAHPRFQQKNLKFVVKDLNTTLSYTGLQKLRNFIKVHKDPLPTLARNNVVYKISCNDCNASYVGQTGRVLATRVNEHRKHINRNTKQISVITEHRQSGHEFDWDNVEILDEEPFLYRRLISEMIYIKRQTNGLNLQNDMDLLGDLYNLIIQDLNRV
ncbi:PREDICTED: uncharacterized protein LOC105565056 [Vollenhovia emeryi]|uniref:uncharacterized protein LOC105565056 n=1 Tax=Vollenhovia emeryi TaxID=411798 RepID=UPI0005F3A678|nr:PREDICTED: uncharacterized protein LOC105565056 [Vollenhovia emeryi]